MAATAVSSSVIPWTLSMAQGSAQEWNIGLTIPGIPGGTTPLPISAMDWQYVARDPDDDGTGTPLISITTSSGAAGLLTVTSSATLSQVSLEMTAGATQSLSPGTYLHALWEYPGSATATAFFTGSLIIYQAPQP